MLTPTQLTQQVVAAKSNLSSLHVPVTVSEMAYGYQKHGGAQNVLDAVDFIDIHMLPFFAQDASTGEKFRASVHLCDHLILATGAASWPIVQRDLQWFVDHGKGKKMYFDEVSTSIVPYGVSFKV